MTKLIVVPLVFALVLTAHAETKIDNPPPQLSALDLEFCSDIAVMAQVTAMYRQHEEPLQRALENDGAPVHLKSHYLPMVMQAYEEPLMKDDKSKSQAIREFADAKHLQCLKDALERQSL